MFFYYSIIFYYSCSWGSILLMSLYNTNILPSAILHQFSILCPIGTLKTNYGRGAYATNTRKCHKSTAFSSLGPVNEHQHISSFSTLSDGSLHHRDLWGSYWSNVPHPFLWAVLTLSQSQSSSPFNVFLCCFFANLPQSWISFEPGWLIGLILFFPALIQKE